MTDVVFLANDKLTFRVSVRVCVCVTLPPLTARVREGENEYVADI